MGCPLYTLTAAADMIGVTPERLSRAITGTNSHSKKAGKNLPPLRAKKLGRRYLILESDLVKWAQGLEDA